MIAARVTAPAWLLVLAIASAGATEASAPDALGDVRPNAQRLRGSIMVAPPAPVTQAQIDEMTVRAIAKAATAAPALSTPCSQPIPADMPFKDRIVPAGSRFCFHPDRIEALLPAPVVGPSGAPTNLLVWPRAPLPPQ